MRPAPHEARGRDAAGGAAADHDMVVFLGHGQASRVRNRLRTRTCRCALILRVHLRSISKHPPRGRRMPSASVVRSRTRPMLSLVKMNGAPSRISEPLITCEVAELAGLHRGVARLQRAVGGGAQHVGRGVAEVDRVPEHHRLHAVALDVGLHRVRRGEADDGDLAALAGLGHGVGRGRRRDRGHAEDALELVAVLVDERVGLVEAEDVVLLRLDGLEPLQLRVALRGIGGHLGDPARLVRRGEGRGDDGEARRPRRLPPPSSRSSPCRCR